MRNVKLAYLLSMFRNAWFWLGIWIFYYLLFTDYAGVGLIEAIVFGAMVATEIPTGAVADLLGKKWTLVAAFVMQAVGNIVMAGAANFNILLLSLPFLAIGGSFYSGAYEALIYDSLKEEGKEKLYDKVLANTTTIALVTCAVAGILGGWIYQINPRLPYYLTGTAYGIGAIVCLMLKEPRVDTEKFSWSNYLRQTKSGFGALYGGAFRYRAILLTVVAALVMVTYQVLDNAVGVELGLSETQMGVLFSIIFLASAGASQLSSWFNKLLKPLGSFMVTSLGIVLTLLLSPFVAIVPGVLTLVARSAFQWINHNAISVLINENTDSRERATTISTFSMLSTAPYVLTAYLVGVAMDQLSARGLAFWLGLVMLVPVALYVLMRKLRMVRVR